MVRSEAQTVEDYLDGLPDDRAEAIQAVREVILANLDEGFVETMNWGMISYEVPLATYPDTYNGKPLMYAALASQKNHMAVYLTSVYATDERRDQFLAKYRATGKKVDVGRSCVRFKTLDQLPLELIGRAIAADDAESFVELVEDRTS
jgi:hypothetical protein